MIKLLVVVHLVLLPIKIGYANVKVSLEQAQCLATILYREARGEGARGMAAVASVALTRASRASPKHGTLDICRVMSAPSQFSWYSKYPYVLPADILGNILFDAYHMLQSYKQGTFVDVTGGATHFAEKHVKNYWTKRMKHTVTIGGHKFYREKK